MEEYTFTGKAKTSGKYVVGDLVTRYNKPKVYICTDRNATVWQYLFEVDPETVRRIE